jgi:hypothetical protein
MNRKIRTKVRLMMMMICMAAQIATVALINRMPMEHE